MDRLNNNSLEISVTKSNHIRLIIKEYDSENAPTGKALAVEFKDLTEFTQFSQECTIKCAKFIQEKESKNEHERKISANPQIDQK